MTIKLNNWRVSYAGPINPYHPPESILTGLVGEVEGHPTRKDGECVRISKCVLFDSATGIISTISGSKYVLGLPHPDYEHQFPNARDRMIENLTEWRRNLESKTE